MAEVLYNPEDAGKTITNSKGRQVVLRKYHLTKEEMQRLKAKWIKETRDCPKELFSKAGKHFFNPYRKGIYYYQLQALFLLGANDWHRFSDILDKTRELMSVVKVKEDNKIITSWDKFSNKARRKDAIRCKDYYGRIEENMLFFQRLSNLHPSGYKLRQVCASVDMKKVSREGFPSIRNYYRLSTYEKPEMAQPLRNYEQFNFPLGEGKYLSNRFIGTIVTKNRTIVNGKVLNEMPQVQSG
jgi:hypothetical protein